MDVVFFMFTTFLSQPVGGFRRAVFFICKKLKKAFDFLYYSIIIISVKREENKT